MMTAGVASSQRFTKSSPCPICDGHNTMPAGKGVRCYGFLSEDGRYAHCTREEHAGSLQLDNAQTYAHILEGPCRCGATHGDATPSPQRREKSDKVRTAIRREAHTLRDADGAALYVHRRIYYSDGEKKVWWEQLDGTANLGGVKMGELPLYGVHELAGASFAILTEGEPSRDALASLGVAALGTVCGAKSVPGDDALSPLLALDTIYLWPDRDADGSHHMASIGARLRALGHDDIRVIAWEESPPKGDAADFVASGATVDRVRELLDAAAALPKITPGNAQTPHTDDDGELWSDRQGLPDPASVPTLPDELLPESLRPWIVDLSDIARIPAEMVAAPALVGLGSIIGRNIGLRPWQYNDHIVVPNTWGMVVSRPGWMKSFAVEEGLKALGRLAALEREAFELRRDQAAAEIAALEAVLTDIKRRMTEAAKNGGVLDDLKERFANKTKELREAKQAVNERRYMTHDATVEKLAELLLNSPRGMLVVRDELYGLLRSFDKSGRENDRQFYLEGWSGTGAFTTDRIGRGTIHVPNMTLSIIGGIQPGRLRSLVDEAASGGGGDDGLLQRFQLTVWPDRLHSWVKPSRWPDGAAKDRMFEIYQRIDQYLPHDLKAARERHDSIPYLTFSTFAQGIADEWRDELETRLRSAEMDNAPAFASHMAKYRSLMPSLALLFHLVDVAAGAPVGPVTEGPTRLAAAWCEFLELHARKLYDVELDRGKSAARALATKVEAGAIVDSQTVREIYRNQWSGLKTDEVVIDGLNRLVSLGWVRLESVSTGGRASQVVRLHPDLRKGGRV